METNRLTPDQRQSVEDWLAARGLPNLIHDYGASTDVFTKATPLFLVLWLFSLSSVFGDRFSGWSQAGAAIVGLAVMTAVAVAVNRFRGRTPYKFPKRLELSN